MVAKCRRRAEETGAGEQGGEEIEASGEQQTDVRRCKEIEASGEQQTDARGSALQSRRGGSGNVRRVGRHLRPHGLARGFLHPGAHLAHYLGVLPHEGSHLTHEFDGGIEEGSEQSSYCSAKKKWLWTGGQDEGEAQPRTHWTNLSLGEAVRARKVDLKA